MNPAVSIALAVVKKFQWSKVPKYIVAQMLGAFFGALVVFITYVGEKHLFTWRSLCKSQVK